MRWNTVIAASEDLITPHAKTRDGFIELALEKNRRAAPYIEQARHLQTLARGQKDPFLLWGIETIRPALLAAAGVSEKAAAHLPPKVYPSVFQKFAKEFLVPAKGKYAEELIYRFLLTKGDALGGKMRNIGGRLGQRKLNRAVLANLSLAGVKYWTEPENYGGMEEEIKCIGWTIGGRPKILAYNITLSETKTNVDLCLAASPAKNWKKNIKSAGAYIALGELKSGFDPAGADEHWKTARGALARLRESIAPCPALFFVGAAVEKAMAQEIFDFLNDGNLQFAANLTADEQLTALCQWIINI